MERNDYAIIIDDIGNRTKNVDISRKNEVKKYIEAMQKQTSEKEVEEK